jgi:hypothetical protein
MSQEKIESACGLCGGIGGGAFSIAVFGLGFPDDTAGLIVGGIGSLMMLIGGFGALVLRALDRRRKRRSQQDAHG